MPQISFKKGNSSNYNSNNKDEYSFYFTEDDNNVYLGEVKLSNEVDVETIAQRIKELDQRVDELENPAYL